MDDTFHMRPVVIREARQNRPKPQQTGLVTHQLRCSIPRPMKRSGALALAKSQGRRISALLIL
jgi:hypothetical protein